MTKQGREMKNEDANEDSPHFSEKQEYIWEYSYFRQDRKTKQLNFRLCPFLLVSSGFSLLFVLKERDTVTASGRRSRV